MSGALCAPKAFGVTPHGYLVRCRIERAGELLANTELSVAYIALATGFSDQGHFARAFRRVAGTTPRTWRRARR